MRIFTIFGATQIRVRMKTTLEKHLTRFLIASLLLALFSGISMQLNGRNYISPFIAVAQSTIPDLNNWARECFEENHKDHFFFISYVFFALGLLCSHYLLYCMIHAERKNGKHVSVKFPSKPLLLLFGLAFVLDISEYIAYFSHFSTEGDNIPYFIQSFKTIAYGIIWALLLYFGLKKGIRSLYSARGKFRFFIRNYLAYFLPSILSVVILFFLFNAMDQFDGLIIQLTEGLNLSIFTILFAGTIIKVWFMPYYLQFTDSFYDRIEGCKCEHCQSAVGEACARESEKVKNEIIVNRYNLAAILQFKSAFFPIRFLLSQKSDDEAEKKSILGSVLIKAKRFLSTQTEEEFSQNLFHILRMLFGLGFILVLFYLQWDALQSVFRIPFTATYATLSLGLFYTGLLLLLYFKTKTIRQRYIQFWILLFIGILTISITIITGKKNPINEEYALAWFVFSTFLVGLSYVFFVVFRLPPAQMKKEKDARSTEQEDKMSRHMDQAQGIATFIIMLLNTVAIPVICILVFFFCLIFDFTFFECLNPANFYLLFVNGIISLIAVIDRLIKIRISRKWHLDNNRSGRIGIKFKREGYIPYVAGLIAIILLVLVLRQQEDFHHEVPYIDRKEKEDQRESLTSYTERFLNRFEGQKDSPIYIIAAQGGGLRAAYWTMLVMDELSAQAKTEEGINFYDHTFLMTGTSGGAIGLGMYNYMKYLDYEESERHDAIENIGSTNFLTSDIAGLFTRSTLTSIVPWRKTMCYKDRHHFMAQQYFEKIRPEKDTKKKDHFISWEKLGQKPFFELWEENKKLPLLLVNTTRTEDGARAVVHPLSKKEDFLAPYLDLSSKADTSFISYPDAVFLTNRFPIASPAARIEGRGHFVDGGYFENSGLKTILHTLRYMKADTCVTSVFKPFFEHPIVLINIQNHKSSYLTERLRAKGITPITHVNRSFPSSEIGSIIDATTQTGVTGLTKYYNKLFRDTSFKNLYATKYHTISLPYYINREDPHELFYGQVKTDACELNDYLDHINEPIDSHKVLMPPLGRMIPRATLKYMKTMLKEPMVQDSILGVF